MISAPSVAELKALRISENEKHAYLTTRLGAETTIADQVADTSFTFPHWEGFYPTQLPLFTGLTLSAGTTYFLTIVPESGASGRWQSQQYASAASDDPHLTILSPTGHYSFVHAGSQTANPADYPPASNFFAPGYDTFVIMTVTGTPVPEPSIIVLFGGLGIFALRRKRQ